jgi:esterase
VILHATEQGQGPPVALLHGLFGRAQNLGAVARALSGGARVISLDLRNHGSSPHAAGMSYPALAADVLVTLQFMGALPAAVLGHSMGGKTAMAMALAAPASVTRLLVADIAPVAYDHHNAGVAAALNALPLTPGLTRAQASALLEGGVPDAGVRAFLLQNLDFAGPAWRIGLAEITAAIADIESWPAYADGTRYEGPALFLSGGRSDYVRPAHVPIIRALFPHASFDIIPDAGHWLHADKSAAFAQAARDFLDRG